MGKIYQEIKKSAPVEAVDLKTAISFIKDHARKTFNETIEIHVHLGINPEKSEQTVRGTVVMPSGAPKSKRIAVFVEDEKQQEAVKQAGAVLAGADKLIKDIERDKNLDVDIVVATPDMMPKIAKIARILGPKGLMPNPKTGTVDPDPTKVVKELMGGKLSFKMDQGGNIHEAVGRASWDLAKIEANVVALIEAIQVARPVTMKGQLIKTVTLSSTMGPGIKVSW